MPRTAQAEKPDEPEDRETDADSAEEFVPNTDTTRYDLGGVVDASDYGRRLSEALDPRTLDQIREISRLVGQQYRVGTQAFQVMQQLADGYARTVLPAVEAYQHAIQRNGAMVQMLHTLGENASKFYNSEFLNNPGILAAMRTMAEVARNNPELFRLSETSTRAMADAMQPLASTVTPVQIDGATAAISALQRYLATQSTNRTEQSLDSDPDADAVEFLLDAVDADDSEESIPQPLLEAIFEDLEASLAADFGDDSLDLPSDLEESSSASDLEPLRALYRLVALQYPDLRDNPRLHRILRRAANGSLVATLFVVWLLNPQFFVVLMTVLGILQTNGIGGRAVDITLARGEKPRSSDYSSEENEDDPDESTEDDA